MSRQYRLVVMLDEETLEIVKSYAEQDGITPGRMGELLILGGLDVFCIPHSRSHEDWPAERKRHDKQT